MFEIGCRTSFVDEGCDLIGRLKLGTTGYFDCDLSIELWIVSEVDYSKCALTEDFFDDESAKVSWDRFMVNMFIVGVMSCGRVQIHFWWKDR